MERQQGRARVKLQYLYTHTFSTSLLRRSRQQALVEPAGVIEIHVRYTSSA
jgi:hypothetical protein